MCISEIGKKKGSAGLDHVKSKLKSQRERVGQPGSCSNVPNHFANSYWVITCHNTHFIIPLCVFLATHFKTYGLFLYITLNSFLQFINSCPPSTHTHTQTHTEPPLWFQKRTRVLLI